MTSLPGRPPASQPGDAQSPPSARPAVIERTDPLGPVAVSRVRELQRALPSLARSPARRKPGAGNCRNRLPEPGARLKPPAPG